MLAKAMSRGLSAQELESEAVGYRDDIRASIRQRTGDDSLAEDVAQETMLRVIDRLHGEGLQDPARLKNFAYRVAANVLAELRRKDSSEVTDNDYVETAASVSEDPFQHRSRAEESRLIWQVLENIGDDGYRDILIRFFLRQQSKQHICGELDLTSRQFTQRIFRAKQSLRKLLEQAEHRHGLRLVE
jgi:RNA polymerase sigma-70 factor (ECF subfamily)